MGKKRKGKFNQEQLNRMDSVQIYKYILSGEVLEFPKGYWLKPEATENAKICTKYMIKEILKYEEEDVKTITANTFRENKLAGMLKYVFNNQPFQIIKLLYPNIKVWEMSQTPRNFWDSDNNKIEAIKWLVEEKLKLSDEDVKNNLSVAMFHDNGLRKCLRTLGTSPFKAINLAYPNKYSKNDFNVKYK